MHFLAQLSPGAHFVAPRVYFNDFRHLFGFRRFVCVGSVHFFALRLGAVGLV